MSRYYELCVEFIGIDLKDVKKVVVDDFGWEEEDSDEETLFCKGSLYGGQGDDEAHEEIYKALKKIKPFCRIRTRWTYLEELPFEEYGDDLDVDDFQEMVIDKLNKIKNEGGLK